MKTALAEVLGNDVAALHLGERPLALRAEWVLRVSGGPVPWAVKYPAYEAACEVPGLHRALLRALVTGYHDVYGDLEPGTEHVAELTAVLEAGHRNHRAAPAAWAGGRGGGR